MGSTWQGSVWKRRPASIKQAPGSHQPSGPTTVQTDYLGSFYIISPTPFPFSPPPDDQQGLAGHRWKVLANITKDPPLPGATWTPNNLTLLAEGHFRQCAERIKRNQRQSPWMREVSTGACDWANWNQHPWLDTQTRALGSASHANISHRLTLPCQQWGQPAEEWQGSHACHEFTERGITEEPLQRHWSSVRLHQCSFARTLKIWIGGSSKPSPRAGIGLGLEHSHLPAGCL